MLARPAGASSRGADPGTAAPGAGAVHAVPSGRMARACQRIAYGGPHSAARPLQTLLNLLTRVSFVAAAARPRGPEARDGLAVIVSAMLAGITEAGLEPARTLGR